MICFGIAGHAIIPRWLRNLYTSACDSDDLTEWDNGPGYDHRRLYSPWNGNGLASHDPRSARNDTRIYLDTEPSPCGEYRPNSPDWTNNEMPQIPTPPNSQQTPDSAYLACAPARSQTPALPEIRKDQPLPKAYSSRLRPKRIGDTRYPSTKSTSREQGPWNLPVIDEAMLVLGTSQSCKYEGVLFGNSIESSLILRIEGYGSVTVEIGIPVVTG
ncbi:hypothetical protein ASPBRDRAFT_70290 [Aspergillus brasiliensis CBS 101740]|uniref:Uncharacterized protein n=1 Tax=Aspergillus brasiliensis (strain CBS 101740 / IMI 381727 / IBT 21946) TaxID=767769 RepID=A0A1L9U1U6_ASPBC|nr:hypothetical protein ASPBRDRAFT_70290 [Aspergillus brasiliensis CBS 101740]